MPTSTPECPGEHSGLRRHGGVLGRKIYILGNPPLYAGSDATVSDTQSSQLSRRARGLSGSTSAVLAYLFPHDAVALNALGDEAGESRLWAGIHFRSDIDTGLALGRAVAKLVIERAEKDGSQ
jgi:hypothetical protein